MSNPATPRETFAATTSRAWSTFPPAADALSQVADGNPMDAGTWCLVANNLNVALDVAPRQLFSSNAGGTTVVTQPTNGGWTGLFEDIPDATEIATSGLLAISWGLRTTNGGPIVAERHGPNFAIRDRLDSVSASALRQVRVRVTSESDSASHLTILVALTQSARPPTEGHIVWASHLVTSTGVSQTAFTLVPTSAGRVTLPTGATTTAGGILTLDAYWVWIGWLHDGTGNHSIHSTSGFEWIA